MEVSFEEFAEICLRRGILASEDALKEIYKELATRDKVLESGNPTRLFIQAYCDAFKQRHGASPVITKKVAGIAGRIVKSLGKAEAIELVQVYLQMANAFYLQRGHDLVTFESSLNSIRIAQKTGKRITSVEARHAEKMDFHKSQLERIRSGEL